jgi:predicted DCC family thiol-disulfide oxidoreductase YuxK
VRQRALLIYDGTCGPCLKGANWLEAHLRKDAELDLVASQSLSDDSLETLELDREKVDESLCWVGVEGVCVGSFALTNAVARMRRPWSTLALIMRSPVVSPVLARSYPVVARNRHRFSRSC